MGDIAFNISKFVDLNKTVDLDINKNVDVDVNIDGQLATAEADAEAFGSPALVEVDAYTLVNSGDLVFIPNQGSVGDPLGAATITPGPDGDGDGASDTITVEEIGFINLGGSGALASLGPPASAFNLNLIQTGLTIPIENGVEAEYQNVDSWVVDFGTRILDLDGDGVVTSGNLTLTVPEDTLFSAQFGDNGEIAVDFQAFDIDGSDGFGGNGPFNGNGYFTFDGIDYEFTTFDLSTFNFGIPENFNFIAVSNFGRFDMSNGQAFAYAESTAALDKILLEVVTFEWLEDENTQFVSRHGVRGPVLADDFIPEFSGTVTKVEWWGSAPITGNEDVFEITFHDNVDPLTGEPDQTPPDGGIAQWIVPVEGVDSDGDGVYHYSLPVPDSSPLDIFLNAGQSYWFSVANEECIEFGPAPGPGCLEGWTWAEIDGISPTVGSQTFTAVESIGIGPNGGPHFGPWNQLSNPITGEEQNFAFRITVLDP